MLYNKAIGATASAQKIYIEDVFSTYLYTGNGSTQTITNGIDLSGKGGLVWLKSRTAINSGGWHQLFDTARGGNNSLATNSTSQQFDLGGYPTRGVSFSSTGFSVADTFHVNTSSDNIVSWTFRKAAKFFDVVTFTTSNTNTNKRIAHSLGSVPGAIIVKGTNAAGNWIVYHRSLGTSNFLYLNTTNASLSSANLWTASGPSSTDFGVDETQFGTGTWVAYLFAHDAGGFGDSGNDNVISCGSFTTNGSGVGTLVSLGWEPQWLIYKSTVGSSGWKIADAMRGIPTGGNDPLLIANSATAENATNNEVDINATGFQLVGNGNLSDTYIYIAIRRGPMKTPTAGTDVFYTELDPQSEFRESTSVPFPPDLVNTFSRNGTDRTSTYNFFQFCDRLRGLGTPNNTFAGGATDAPVLISSSTGAENDPAFNTSFIQLKADGQNITGGTGWNSTLYGNYLNYFFRRAPGFFDAVTYTGTGSTRTVVHNLGVEPELIIVKRRSAIDPWPVYIKSFTNTFRLNSTDGAGFNFETRFVTIPTSSVFSVGTDSETNATGSTYIAYLFASCPGVSKIGTYTGNGTGQDINCGFTNGARFVLIKQNANATNWLVFDTARGIIEGDDPRLNLNDSSAETTGDIIDPVSTGFRLPNTSLTNTNGAQYIFLAIA